MSERYTGQPLEERLKELETKCYDLFHETNAKYLKLEQKVGTLDLEKKLKINYILKMNQLEKNDKTHQALYNELFKRIEGLEVRSAAHTETLRELISFVEMEYGIETCLLEKLDGEKTVDVNNPMSCRSGMKTETDSKPSKAINDFLDEAQQEDGKWTSIPVPQPSVEMKCQQEGKWQWVRMDDPKRVMVRREDLIRFCVWIEVGLDEKDHELYKGMKEKYLAEEDNDD